MDDKEFRAQYKKEFDNICASDELKSAVKNMKPQKPRHVITPFKATLGTVAAAIMIFAAVHDYNFETDTSGVISETVVSTQLPDAEFKSVAKNPEISAEPRMPEREISATEELKKKESAVIQKPTQKAVPASTPKPQQKSQTKNVEISATQAPAPQTTQAAMTETEVVDDNTAIAPFSEVGPSPRSTGGAAYALRTTAVWTIGEYYEYLGVDVSQRIAGRYTGSQSLEFELGSNGLPVDDTVVLDFVTDSGANVSLTVSRNALFNASQSGTVTENGNGYKVSNGIYYKIYAAGATQEEITSIVNSL